MMFENQSFATVELDRQLHNLIRIGEVTEVSDAGQVKVTDGELESPFLDRAVSSAGERSTTWHPLSVGEQVIVFCPSGDFSQGIVVGSLPSEKFPACSTELEEHRTVFKDEANFSYNHAKHELKVILPEGAKVTVVSNGGIDLTGDTNVIGNLHVTGDIKGDKEITDKTRSMDADRKIYNKHKHGGVQGGPGTTQPPATKQ